MNVENYEFSKEEEMIELGEKIQQDLIQKMQLYIRKGNIQLGQLLNITENNSKLDFMYSWLYDNNISITGTNVSMSGELSNYKHRSKVGQSYLPPSCTKEENLEYAKRAQNGDINAKNELIKGNLRLARWYVQHRVPYKIQKIVGIQDLEQCAAMGIMKACEKFDYKRGYSFSTHAMQWIRKYVYREISNVVRAYRIPVNQVEKINKLERVEIQIEKDTGKEPSTKQIAKSMGIPKEEVIKLQGIRLKQDVLSLEDIVEKSKDEEVRINELLDTDRPQDMTNAFIIDGVYKDEHEENEEHIKEHITINDQIETNTEFNAEMNVLREKLEQILGELSERECGILRLRFGLDDGYSKTLKQVGNFYGISGETIRQIEAKALRKLRHPYWSRNFVGYLEDFDRNKNFSPNLSRKVLKEKIDEEKEREIAVKGVLEAKAKKDSVVKANIEKKQQYEELNKEAQKLNKKQRNIDL